MLWKQADDLSCQGYKSQEIPLLRILECWSTAHAHPTNGQGHCQCTPELDPAKTYEVYYSLFRITYSQSWNQIVTSKLITYCNHPPQWIDSCYVKLDIHIHIYHYSRCGKKQKQAVP